MSKENNYKSLIERGVEEELWPKERTREDQDWKWGRLEEGLNRNRGGRDKDLWSKKKLGKKVQLMDDDLKRVYICIQGRIYAAKDHGGMNVN